MQRVPVAIVGGGPVGMVLAIGLARFGVRSMLVNTEPSTRWFPKGSTHNARTMEHYRRLGLARGIRTLGLPAEHATDVGFFTTLNGLGARRAAARAVGRGVCLHRHPARRPLRRFTDRRRGRHRAAVRRSVCLPADGLPGRTRTASVPAGWQLAVRPFRSRFHAAALHGDHECDLALIRPGQHVAWRGSALPADCGALLARVTGW
jgi:hypothetical protein